MRVVGGAAFIAEAARVLPVGSSFSTVGTALATLAGACLIAGFWTPIAGSVITVAGLWFALAHTGNPLASVLLSTIGAALALVGPGAWSIDARLFGWKRIGVARRPDRVD